MRNKNIEIVYRYHNETKHSKSRYARSTGYMDWANQPNPFREYPGAKKIWLELPQSHATPPYNSLDRDLTPTKYTLESVSQFLRFGMGIAAYKTNGQSAWAVRCNASSGNLHPTECYLILPSLSDSIVDGLYHYDVKNHALELLAEIESDFFLPSKSFIVGLSSIAWREVWKYGERAFRYVNLDVGHAWQSINISAKMVGWSVTRVGTVKEKDIQKLFGFDRQVRFVESEYADMILVVSQEEIKRPVKLSVPTITVDCNANRLSPQERRWRLIDEIIEATGVDEVAKPSDVKVKTHRSSVKTPSGDVVLNRRSVHVMQKEQSIITSHEFHQILQSVNGSLDGTKSSANLCIFVHRIKEYPKGLYIFIRDKDALESLKSAMKSTFLWDKTGYEHLYRLEYGDFTEISKMISCSQDIASDGSFSLGMLCGFDDELKRYGAHRYRELYWECGCVGQQLYLEATSLGLSATGIGCFLDDEMHLVLGLTDTKFQILYHLTVGRGYVDRRIMTLPPYSQRIIKNP